jgi:hypothetical protein
MGREYTAAGCAGAQRGRDEKRGGRTPGACSSPASRAAGAIRRPRAVAVICGFLHVAAVFTGSIEVIEAQR